MSIQFSCDINPLVMMIFMKLDCSLSKSFVENKDYDQY